MLSAIASVILIYWKVSIYSKYDILTNEPRMLTVETLHHKYELNSFKYCHIQLTVKVTACGAMCRGQI